MIDVTEALTDPDFITDFTVQRTTSRWENGRFREIKTEHLPFSFPAHPATEKELEQLPEGDRNKEVMTFFCVSPHVFYQSDQETPGDPDADVIYDYILYKGNRYKIIKVKDWCSHGWMRAFGVRIEPAGKE